MFNRTAILEKLETGIKSFKQFTLSKVSFANESNQIIAAHKDWLVCYDKGDCDAFLQAPEIQKALTLKQQAEYFNTHPELLTSFMPDFLDNNPQLIDKYHHNFEPTFVMKTAVHINSHAELYTVGSFLLVIICALQLKKINPFRLFSCFTRSPQPISETPTVKTRGSFNA
jgi:hypothetical protein